MDFITGWLDRMQIGMRIPQTNVKDLPVQVLDKNAGKWHLDLEGHHPLKKVLEEWDIEMINHW